MIGRRRCPACGERVRNEAIVCRYCQSPLEPLQAESSKGGRIAAIVAGCALIGGAGYLGAMKFAESAHAPAISTDSEEVPDEATGVPLAQDPAGTINLQDNQVVEWSADGSRNEEHYRFDGMLLTLTKRVEDGLYAPKLSVEAGGKAIVMEGSEAGSSFTHQITAFRLVSGGAPAVLFQSFSGGAHCCNIMQVVTVSNGVPQTIDLGSWDGEYISAPKDLNGDGSVDFQLSDNGFLYAFAPYAMSYAPYKFLNIENGKVVDVSGRKSFRKYYASQWSGLREACTTGGDGNTRNGACAAFVAVAARLGRISEAWPIMIASYDATANWEFPTGCRVRSASDNCPEAQVINFQGYPDSLLNFLKVRGYVGSSWLPPEAFNARQFDGDNGDFDAASGGFGDT